MFTNLQGSPKTLEIEYYSIGSMGQFIDCAVGPSMARIKSTLPSGVCDKLRNGFFIHICPIRNPKEPFAANQGEFSAHADYPLEVILLGRSSQVRHYFPTVLDVTNVARRSPCTAPV
jgi:hypothetical protein